MPIENTKEIGNRIKEIRNSKGLSQEELAYESGLDRTYINAVEKGKRNITLASLEKITSSLGISFKNFFDENFIFDIDNSNTVYLVSCDDDNYQKTMIEGINIVELEKYFNSNDFEQIKKYAINGIAYVWGTSIQNTNKFNSVNIGNLCIYSKKKTIIGVSTLLYKCESTKFSKKYWKSKKNPNFIWPNILIMSKPIELNIPSEKLMAAGKYRKTFVQGFTIPRGKHNVLIKQFIDDELNAK